MSQDRSDGKAPRTSTMTTSALSAARAHHAQLEARNAVHRRFGFDSEASVRFVLEQALPLRGRVLDVGTGKGRFVVPLARHCANVTTVDVNGEEQAQARLEARLAGVADRIRFVIHDARFLPWPAAGFHAVVSWNVFHHLDDPERVLGEMLRVLKRAGWAVRCLVGCHQEVLIARRPAASGQRGQSHRSTQFLRPVPQAPQERVPVRGIPEDPGSVNLWD